MLADPRSRPATRPSHVRSRKSFDHSPMLLFYELTRACDLVCQHCRACAQKRPAPGELSTAESKRLIDQLGAFPEPPMLILTGGDPLKRDDIYELVRYAVVAGSFDHSIAVLKIARELGVETQINTTLSPANVDQIERMGERFGELGIVLWSVFFLIPVGRATRMARLNADECEAAFARLHRQAASQPFMVKTTEAPHYRRHVIQNTPKRAEAAPRGFLPAGVNDGKGVMFVSHTGEIFPTGFLPIHCGKFPEQSVVDVYQHSATFKMLRDSDQLQGK
ncbi:4Fe-4S cluster-binding domain-containing protein [Roseimaritima sediminicola]|uniref:4Fe-4S cluster-binding domain-containing protein n=1 Tax=Roseimaritima sediminicola TaxID=2662066 RepID=UPI001F2E0FE1|nr:4Fe-4S cluster-binding domain-containing protein [Roseimaritima sediminicola]